LATRMLASLRAASSSVLPTGVERMIAPARLSFPLATKMIRAAPINGKPTRGRICGTLAFAHEEKPAGLAVALSHSSWRAPPDRTFPINGKGGIYLSQVDRRQRASDPLGGANDRQPSWG
jgi:hypothetical protein